MTEAELFFVAEAIRHAKRNLTLGDAIMFIEGMAATLGVAHPGQAQITAARDYFNAGDAQLELLASGQLKFEALL